MNEKEGDGESGRKELERQTLKDTQKSEERGKRERGQNILACVAPLCPPLLLGDTSWRTVTSCMRRDVDNDFGC